MSLMHVPEAIMAECKTLQLKQTSEGMRFVLASGETTVARYLTRNLKLKDKGYADNIIRDMAEEIEMSLKPPELVFCKTMDDYNELYQCAPSCMSNPPGPGYDMYTSKTCELIWERHKLWASSMLYYYIPGLEGVMLKKGSEYVARGLVFDRKKCGSIYGKLWSQRDVLIDFLSKEGIRHTSYTGWEFSPIRVPSVHLDDLILGPAPKSDIYGGNIFVGYDKKSDEFIYGSSVPNCATRIFNPPSIHVHKQWIEAKECSQL